MIIVLIVNISHDAHHTLPPPPPTPTPSLIQVNSGGATLLGESSTSHQLPLHWRTLASKAGGGDWLKRNPPVSHPSSTKRRKIPPLLRWVHEFAVNTKGEGKNKVFLRPEYHLSTDLPSTVSLGRNPVVKVTMSGLFLSDCHTRAPIAQRSKGQTALRYCSLSPNGANGKLKASLDVNGITSLVQELGITCFGSASSLLTRALS